MTYTVRDHLAQEIAECLRVGGVRPKTSAQEKEFCCVMAWFLADLRVQYQSERYPVHPSESLGEVRRFLRTARKLERLFDSELDDLGRRRLADMVRTYDGWPQLRDAESMEQHLEQVSSTLHRLLAPFSANLRLWDQLDKEGLPVGRAMTRGTYLALTDYAAIHIWAEGFQQILGLPASYSKGSRFFGCVAEFLERCAPGMKRQRNLSEKIRTALAEGRTQLHGYFISPPS